MIYPLSPCPGAGFPKTGSGMETGKPMISDSQRRDLQISEDIKWDRGKTNPLRLKSILSLTRGGEGMNHEWHHGAVQL